MKPLILLCSLLSLCTGALAQRQCVAFSPENSSTSHFSQNALQSALTQSGDVDFFSSEHAGCWTVHEISSSVSTSPQVYAISWVVTDVHDLYVGHGLNIGQQAEFTKAMQAAAAAAIQDIRKQSPH